MHCADVLQSLTADPQPWIAALHTLLPFGGYYNNIPFTGPILAADGQTAAPVQDHLVIWIGPQSHAILMDTNNRSRSAHGTAISGMGAILEYLLNTLRQHSAVTAHAHALMSMMLHIASNTMIETNLMYVEAVSSALDHFLHIVPNDQRAAMMPGLFCQRSSKFAYIPLDQQVVMATIRKFSMTMSMQNMSEDNDPFYVVDVTGVIN